MNCLDCFNCKINRSKGYIRCRVKVKYEYGDENTYSMWIGGDGKEKIVKLRYSEIIGTLIIKRNQFNSFNHCPEKSID